MEFDQYCNAVKAIERFWFTIATLPSRSLCQKLFCLNHSQNLHEIEIRIEIGRALALEIGDEKRGFFPSTLVSC